MTRFLPHSRGEALKTLLSNLLSLTTCRLHNQIKMHTSAHILHHLCSHHCVIILSLDRKPLGQASGVKQVMQGHDQSLLMWGNVRQLIELKPCQMTTSQRSTHFELTRSHCMSPCQLSVAANAQRADEQPLKHATLRMVFTFHHRQWRPENCACDTTEAACRGWPFPSIACHVVHVK